jgi:DNA polymerase III epsilon subunit family exonuclease
MQEIRQRSFDDLGTPLSEVTFVVVDVETTGGSPGTASLTEIAAARYRGGELLQTFQTLVRPAEPIPPFITALTGISDAMVAGAPPVSSILPSLLEFVGTSVLVGHNVRFDLAFLDHALVGTGRDRLSETNRVVDTLRLARRLYGAEVRDCKLGTLAASLRLAHRPSHRALDDVLATGDLLHAILERAGTFGVVGLAELFDLPLLAAHPHAAKLRLTARLPHRPGVYCFRNAVGDVLYVGKATDIQARVRSYFTSDRRSKVTRLLGLLAAIDHQVCATTLEAAVLEGRLIRAWTPPFNQHGRARRSSGPVPPEHTGGRRRHSRALASLLGAGGSDAGRGGDLALLDVARARLAVLSRDLRYEEAAAVRDAAERLRRAIEIQREVEALEGAGCLVLDVAGAGTVTLDRGFLADATREPTSPLSIPPDHHPAERQLVAQWIGTHLDRIRLDSATHGLAWPTTKLPPLTGGHPAPPPPTDTVTDRVG